MATIEDHPGPWLLGAELLRLPVARWRAVALLPRQVEPLVLDDEDD